MKTIYKYHVPINDEFSLELPSGAKILCVGVQNNEPYIWVLVYSDYEVIKRYFSWRGTGHDCSNVSSANYIGTVQLYNGQLVFHLFESL